MNLEFIKQKFRYEDGKLFCITPGRWFQKRVGYYHTDAGYRKVKVGRKNVPEHRIIFLLCYGYLPDIIDHIDGNTINNKIENLREATHTQNMGNRKTTEGSSKYKGVTFQKDCGMWRATAGGKYLGIFNSEIEAALEYDKAAKEIYGEFAKVNFN